MYIGMALQEQTMTTRSRSREDFWVRDFDTSDPRYAEGWEMRTIDEGPFTREAAIQKVRLAEDAWNTRDPQRVALAYTVHTIWRNRAEFPVGRAQVQAFLERKWARELDYRLIKELWAHDGHRIAVRFAYEWHDDAGNWFRSYGNENWEFDDLGYMHRRFASINDKPIAAADRKFHWPQGRRPDDHPGLSELGL